MSNTFEGILKRFKSLYPKLLHTDPSKVTITNQIKLSKSIAKSEAISIDDTQQFPVLQALDQNIKAILSADHQTFSIEDLFQIYLSIELNEKNDEKHQFLLDLLKCVFRRSQLYISKRKMQTDEISIDLSIKIDEDLNSQMEVCRSILKRLIKTGQEGLLNFLDYIQSELEVYFKSQENAYLNLEEFAPTSIAYILLDEILKSKSIVFSEQLTLKLSQLMMRTFDLLDVYRNNAKYFIINVASSKNEIERQVRRKSLLFTEILELLVQYCCRYLKNIHLLGQDNKYIEFSIKLWNTLYADLQDIDVQAEYFTLRERLKILAEINPILNQIPQICDRPYYWKLIRDGLIDPDNYCRKVSMSVLKGNLQIMSRPEVYEGMVSQQQFEQLWTTFFDLYDTLESFGSHLTKAVWERTEVLYAFIKKHYTKDIKLHPLLDFKEWLITLYRRVNSHSNLKLRRYTQKSTLKRQYMTNFMEELLFDELLISFNKGLIFKDSNAYTQYSKNQNLVLDFYERYFKNECLDIVEDMRKMYLGFIRNVTHPQMILCTLKILSKAYTTCNRGFLGNDEMTLLSEIIKDYFFEQFFSNKFLCFKYILQMLSLYIDQTQLQTFDWSQFFRIIGKMPIEFFSTQTIYQDNDALQGASQLIEKLGKQRTQEVIASYINDGLQIKAMITAMPKYGNEVNQVLNGISKMLLIMSVKYEEAHSQWFSSIFKPNMENLTQILNSSYLSQEVIDSKVHFLTTLTNPLYQYSNEKQRQFLKQDFIPIINMVLDRFENSLVLPLLKYELLMHQPSEISKIQSIFSKLKSYTGFITLSIKMIHIDQNQSHSGLEKTIKLVLEHALKFTSEKEKSQQKGWGQFLMQYVVFTALKDIAKCYSQGIKECIRKGIQYFLVPEDIFTIGKPLLHNLVEFKEMMRPSEEEVGHDGNQMLIENSKTLSSMQQKTLMNQWKIIAELISIFQFESQLKQELILLYPLIADKTIEFLDCATNKYNTTIFQILKNCYLPVLIQKMQSGDPYKQEQEILRYQDICRQCWKIITVLKTEFKLVTIQEIFELLFNAEIMEIYLRILSPTASQSVREFHKEMASEIFEHGNKYWLVQRTAFNHLMFIFVKRPHLIQGFENFIIDFAISRELRSLDSEIMMYRLQTMIPQIIPKEYETNMNLEELTYQGAYIRTITLIILEGMIITNKRILLENQQVPQNVLDFTTSIENLIIMAMELNLHKKYEKCDMPYSEKHRIKIRLWQLMIVLMEHLDPKLYTKEFRKFRIDQTNGDLIGEANILLWKALQLHHIPTLRQYIEIFAIKFVLAYPQETIEGDAFNKTLLDPNMRPQVAGSYLIIAGYTLIKELNAQNVVTLKQKVFDNFVGFSLSNSAHVRCISQYFIYKLQKDPQFGSFIPSALRPLLDYMEKNKDTQRMFKKYDVELGRLEEVALKLSGVNVILSTRIDPFGEYMSIPFIETLRDVTSEFITSIRNEDQMPGKIEDYWMVELERRKAEGDYSLKVNEESNSNYQRKILPWEQIEYDYEQLKRLYENRERNEIIMCASLIDKIPNLAGLARTCEIMNASALVINNRAVTQTDEFKGVSVTSEKWLPIFEIQEKELLQYLEFQKSNGYKILGLEQTANSKMLHEYKFPSKCVFLLGKEKEGIPQEYLSVLDECIEIPQFGIIRSLNVHVSGALCLWEYTKQHIPEKKI